MGTSASYRAPATPRWSAFVSALSSDQPLERVRSELFNAGEEWKQALASPAVATFALAAERSFDEMPSRLAETRSVADAVRECISEARAASRDAGFSPATPVAERAFARLLLATVGGADSPTRAAEQWLENRGASAAEAVSRYFGEVLGQFAAHVADREAGRLAERGIGARASSGRSAELAGSAREIASLVSSRVSSTDTTARWDRLVSAAFEAGGALPGRRR